MPLPVDYQAQSVLVTLPDNFEELRLILIDTPPLYKYPSYITKVVYSENVYSDIVYGIALVLHSNGAEFWFVICQELKGLVGFEGNNEKAFTHWIELCTTP
jgi:hypothetical protein